MINYLKNGDIDRKKWDNCIKTSRQGLVYGLSWYLDLVCPGWSGLVMDDYSAVMPLPVKSRMGISYVYQPVFAQQLGIFTRIDIRRELTLEFLKAIPGYLKYIDYNLNQYHTEGLENFSPQVRNNYELKLNTPYHEIEKGFSENTRRNIKKSLFSNGIDSNVSVGEIAHLKRMVQTGKRKPEFYQWLNTYMHKLIQYGNGSIVGVRINDRLVAAAFFLICMNRIYYLIPVSDEEGKKNRAMFAILDHVIGKYADTGLIFDFEGSSIQGIARFFAGFGAEKKMYTTIKINRLPFPLNLVKK